MNPLFCMFVYLHYVEKQEDHISQKDGQKHFLYSPLQIKKNRHGETGYFEQIKDAEDGGKPETEVIGNYPGHHHNF